MRIDVRDTTTPVGMFLPYIEARGFGVEAGLANQAEWHVWSSTLRPGYVLGATNKLHAGEGCLDWVW